MVTTIDDLSARLTTTHVNTLWKLLALTVTIRGRGPAPGASPLAHGPHMTKILVLRLWKKN